MSSCPSGVSGTQRSSIPRSAASMCHGTMLAWCSISVSTTTSPGPRLARPHAAAIRFIASVAFLVKMISSEPGALTNRATARRAFSYASVASPASRYELRLIGAYDRSRNSDIASITRRGFWLVLPESR